MNVLTNCRCLSEAHSPREEGWLRRQEMLAKPTLTAADGVVTHKPCCTMLFSA